MKSMKGISHCEAARLVSKDLEEEDPFFILDTRDLYKKISTWNKLMPRIKPFYAVKCNDNPMVLKLLAGLGIGFDVASKKEMSAILEIGVHPSRLVFSQPCKYPSHLHFAKECGVSLMTFDNEDELYKIKQIYPDARLLLRVRYDGKSSMCLGTKFGTEPELCTSLLMLARHLGLNVVGVAFHVGSTVEDGESYVRAIKGCRWILDQAEAIGFTPSILDIGGGFPQKASGGLFSNITDSINQALDQYFPEDGTIQVIAEPGRYVVGTALSLVTNVTSRRLIKASNGEIMSAMYYINDGVFGSFSTLITQKRVLETPILIRKYQASDHNIKSDNMIVSKVWGPTCTSYDQVSNGVELPLLAVGDLMIWPAMGDYTLNLQTINFNGYNNATVKCCIID